MSYKTNKIIVLVAIILTLGTITGAIGYKYYTQKITEKTKTEIKDFILQFRRDSFSCVQPVSPESLDWREKWDIGCWDWVAKKYTIGDAYKVALEEKEYFLDNLSLNLADYTFSKAEIKSLTANVLNIDIKNKKAVGETILEAVYYYKEGKKLTQTFNDVLRLQKIGDRWYIIQLGDFYN